MTRYVGFLRAINVGGHIVKMHDLRRLFENMGFAHVETYIQSGNVIFDSAAESSQQIEQTVAAGLQQALGYAVATFVRSLHELAAVARHTPFQAAELDAGATLYIAFLRDQPSAAAQRALLALSNEVDVFHVNQREVFWLCRKSFRESTFSGARLEKMLGMPATIRNVSTVRKLAAKYTVPENESNGPPD